MKVLPERVYKGEVKTDKFNDLRERFGIISGMVHGGDLRNGGLGVNIPSSITNLRTYALQLVGHLQKRTREDEDFNSPDYEEHPERKWTLMAVDKQDPFDFDRHNWPPVQELRFDSKFKIKDNTTKRKAKGKKKYATNVFMSMKYYFLDLDI